MKSFALSVVLMLLANLALCGQTIRLQADIPFRFEVGTNVLPAGPYSISAFADILAMRTSQGSARSVFALCVLHQLEPHGEAGLVFNRYGDDYFLAGVRGPNRLTGRAMAPGRREQALIRSLRFPEKTEIIAYPIR